MSSAARTSVVVVHWNTPDLLLRCLEGLREPREHGRVDVLVIDNCSREDGFPDIGELPGLRIVRNPGNHGFARAANQGADWARGEFLLLLNADAAISGQELAALEAALDADPGLAAVAPCALGPGGTLSSPAMRFLDPLNHAAGLLGLGRSRYRSDQNEGGDDGAGLAGVVDVDWLTASVILFRSAAFGELCGFDEAYFFYGEDEDLCWRLRRRGYRVAVHHGIRVRDERGASAGQVPGWAQRQLYRGHLRFMRRRGGPLAVLAYRVVVSTALVLKLVSGRGRSAQKGTGPLAALRCIWGRQRLHTVRN